MRRFLSKRATPPLSEVWVYDGNGWGSTNTAIRRWLTIGKQQGSAITYLDSAADGATFTINEKGIYCISYSDAYTGMSVFGVTLNSSELTTSMSSVTATDRLIATHSTGANTGGSCSITAALSPGDIIRSHSSTGLTDSGSTYVQMFRIVQVARL